eukprot:gene27918-2524_t
MATGSPLCYELVLTITNTVACMLSSKWGTLPLLESGVGGLTTFWRHISYLPLILESGTLNFQSRLVLSTLGPGSGRAGVPDLHSSHVFPLAGRAYVDTLADAYVLGPMAPSAAFAIMLFAIMLIAIMQVAIC